MPCFPRVRRWRNVALPRLLGWQRQTRTVKCLSRHNMTMANLRVGKPPPEKVSAWIIHHHVIAESNALTAGLALTSHSAITWRARCAALHTPLRESFRSLLPLSCGVCSAGKLHEPRCVHQARGRKQSELQLGQLFAAVAEAWRAATLCCIGCKLSDKFEGAYALRFAEPRRL